MKLLIVRIGAMGDVLHALPAVAALRRAQPAWRIEWAVDTRWLPLLTSSEGDMPLIDAVHPADTRLWSRAPLSSPTRHSILQLRGNLQAARFDAVADLQGTIRSAVIARLSGAANRAGYADPRESAAAWLYTRKLSRCGTHVVEQAAALLGAVCGLALTPAVPQMPVDREAEAWADEAVLRRPFCLLAPGAGWTAKQWSTEKFGALAQQLVERGFHVAVNASNADDELAGRAAAASRGAARVLPCTVAQLIALLRRTDLFIGGDSGPTHLAATLAVPLVALFGPTSPERNGPWGAGPHRVLRHADSVTSYRHVATPDAGLAQITVEQVLGAIEDLKRRDSEVDVQVRR